MSKLLVWSKTQVKVLVEARRYRHAGKKEVKEIGKEIFSDLKEEKYRRRLEVDIIKFDRRSRLAKEYKEMVEGRDYGGLRGRIIREEGGDSLGSLSSSEAFGSGHGSRCGSGSFPHPIENTINSMTADILTTIILELSARKALLDDIQDSRILLQSSIGKEVQVKSQISHLIDSLGNTPGFSSIPNFRVLYNYFKSGDWLGYGDNEIFREAKGVNNGYINRYETDDLIPHINDAFEEYTNTKEPDQLSKVTLMIKLMTILNTSSAPISIKTFTSILQQLNRIDLIVYEQTILKHLIPFRARSSVLSREFWKVSQSSLIVHYYQGLIEQDPEFLTVLFNFYHKQKNRSAIKHLFSFLKFDEILELERIYNSSIYSQLLSKSRFLKTRNITDLTQVSYHSTKPLSLSKSSIYTIIGICSNYDMSEYIDFMINKVVFQSLENGQVLLSFSEEEVEKFVIDNDDLDHITRTIFDDELIMCLLKVIDQSNDLGRLMWLIPFLDVVFEELKNRDVINFKMVSAVFMCLSKFGVDGKLLSYERMLGLTKEETRRVTGAGCK